MTQYPIPEEMELIYPSPDPQLPVVAIDFDGVLAKSTWPSPELGDPDEDAIDMACHYFNLGCEILVFTARPPSHWPRIWRWLAVNGLDDVVYDVTNRKEPACLYFDDRAVKWPL